MMKVMSSNSTLFKTIEEALKRRMSLQEGEMPVLEEAIAHALLKGGRRLRPLLALIVAENLPYPEAALSAALATEYFHAASLVADDLPSMDDAKSRRDNPSLHTLYGEANALLVTYALISDGYQLLAESSFAYPQAEERGQRLGEALSLASRATGLKGATGGQYLDLGEPPTSLDALLDLLKRKTASFFSMAFGMGWIFGGGDIEKLKEVEEAAYHFGLGFQLTDDLIDEESDRLSGKGCNLCVHLGREKVERILAETSKKFGEAVRTLGLTISPFEELSISHMAV